MQEVCRPKHGVVHHRQKTHTGGTLLLAPGHGSFAPEMTEYSRPKMSARKKKPKTFKLAI